MRFMDEALALPTDILGFGRKLPPNELIVKWFEHFVESDQIGQERCGGSDTHSVNGTPPSRLFLLDLGDVNDFSPTLGISLSWSGVDGNGVAPIVGI
jgi:hypothetical protein